MSTRHGDTLVMTSVRDAKGLMHREVRLVPGGGLAIAGHDLGPGVEGALGVEEYEFERTLDAESVRQLVAALGGGDVLELVGERFTSTFELERFLEQHGIASSFWNRMG